MSRRKQNIRSTFVFHQEYTRLKNIAMSVFEWEGLPETCNARFLEKCLYENGRAVFVDDPVMGFLNLRVNPTDTMNVYEEPTGYWAYSVNYDSKHFDREHCVYIRNNYAEHATDEMMLMFAERLAKIQIAIDININAQKTPLLIRTDDKTKLSMNAVYNQYDGDKPVIVVDKSMSDKPIEVLRTDAPFIADKLREEKRAVWNEALEFLGLNTNPSDKKKERLITSEVSANDEQIDIQFETMLLCRQEACDKINELFGLNVSVKKRIEEEEDELWQSTLLNSEPSLSQE